MPSSLADPARFFPIVTRLGEAQLLLPALLGVSLLYLLRTRARVGAGPMVRAWFVAVGAAAVVTTLTKVAFIGYGVGHAPLNYTGISGHAMFAAAVLPLLACAAASAGNHAVRRAALGAAFARAGLVAWSRVEVGAHSWSEVLLGFCLGAAASAIALRAQAVPPTRAAMPLLLALGAWFSVGTAAAPPSPTHGWVVRLSLAVSGRAQPYTREMMLATLPRTPHAPRARWAAPRANTRGRSPKVRQ